MAGMMASGTASGLGTALTVGSMFSSMMGQKQAADNAQAQAAADAQNKRIAADFEARQAEYLANQSLATSHIEAREQKRNAALLASKALATAAGSGAGASDPDVVNILSQIYSEGAYRAALALYQGEEQARSYGISAVAHRLGAENLAAAGTAQADSIARASNMSMFSTLLKGSSSLFERYAASQ